MQTNLCEEYRDSRLGREADRILRTCVHCGFCTATCPTYQLLGDELDGPRGRIYLIKQVLEGQPVSVKTQRHLDRCLTCRSCETTCPSGVRYGRLIDIGREITERQVGRNTIAAGKRLLLRKILPYPRRFAPLLGLAQMLRPMLPTAIRAKLPGRQMPPAWPDAPHPRRMLVLEGCVQSKATPATNTAAARVLSKLGIQLLRTPAAGCCGAVSQHLAAPDEAKGFIRHNIDAWWPLVEQGIEAIVITASGCGTMVKDYGELMRDDTDYAAKATRISALAKDIGEILSTEELPPERINPRSGRIAFHSPCSLQHGQQLNGVVESLLSKAGFTLTAVPDAHLCCGSAGTYSILQPDLSEQLRQNKVSALESDAPEVIATANVGCQMHLSGKTTVPVRHWVELMDEALD